MNEMTFQYEMIHIFTYTCTLEMLRYYALLKSMSCGWLASTGIPLAHYPCQGHANKANKDVCPHSSQTIFSLLH